MKTSTPRYARAVDVFIQVRRALTPSPHSQPLGFTAFAPALGVARALLMSGRMADFTAIADVSQTLITLLGTGLSDLGTTVELHDLQVAPATSNLLTLFLFQIREDGHSRNRPPEVRTTGGSATIIRPPLALSVHYMLTPWASKHDDNQRILGQAMRTLHDHAIVSGADLLGSLNAANETVHLALVPMSIEDQLRVWHGFNKPYRLSLHYEARVIRIDSQDSTPRALTRSRGIAPAQPEIQP